jgi:hypothetical protein
LKILSVPSAILKTRPIPPKIHTLSIEGLFLMTQSDNLTPNPAPISTVTKHIKLYSNNPIHNAIDRIIDSCAFIDEDGDYFGLASKEMLEAAEDLIALSIQNLQQLQLKRERDYRE